MRKFMASVTSMGGSAFYGCTSLKDIYFEGDKEDKKMRWLDVRPLHFFSIQSQLYSACSRDFEASKNLF